MEFNPRRFDQKWQRIWDEHQTYRTENHSEKPKYYILDMFPYPSGKGLHVGHPLGYIASDIYARYKRLKGFNVLHPMGFDSFGLPAEQYAIQTGQHPAITTERNIATYIQQLKNIGLSFDWSREVRTSEPSYYKWTQWIFMELFRCWYNRDTDRAEPIETLTAKFAEGGSAAANTVCDDDTPTFTADEWNAWSEQQQYAMTLKYRLTYVADAVVNWCPALGTVLANDEVVNGVSERGGYPVEQKLMRQWMMRITAYADRLLSGLETIDWSESLKEQQRNWIGKSVGAEVEFAVQGHDAVVSVYTTRIDTIYGVSFMVLAPEHELVAAITTDEHREEVEAYVERSKRRTERERLQDAKTITGAFTGAYCVHPFSGEPVPIWIADYVLAGYGTGAVMAVPSGDQRDWAFAKHFELPIVPISDAQKDLDQQADPTKEGRYINSGIINGMTYKEAIETLIGEVEKRNIGKAKTQFRLRDAVFGRQRYWGEPVPVRFIEQPDGSKLPYLISEEALPLQLPQVDKYLPTETGEPPLARAEGWDFELSTMPGWAGSSWYWYRYMDPDNNEAFASKEAIEYWRDVDFYIGGSEHATGHLLYSRFWNKFLKDRGHVPEEEPFKRLVNQGMIQGRSLFLYINQGENSRWLHIDVTLADKDDRIDYDTLADYFMSDNRFEGVDLEQHIGWEEGPDGKLYAKLNPEVEKMSKSKYNVVNPDDVIETFGADVFRMYEMFLGPIEQAKPWDTRSIDGVARFMRRFWTLFADEQGNSLVTDQPATNDELKVLHTLLKKVTEDVERLSFNTCVAAFMVYVNDLKKLNCNKRCILEPAVVALAPFAPHITEEIWENLGNSGSVHQAAWPAFDEQYLVADTVDYPVCINGKKRADLTMPAGATAADIEAAALALPATERWLEGRTPKKVIVLPGKMVNIVA